MKPDCKTCRWLTKAKSLDRKYDIYYCRECTMDDKTLIRIGKEGIKFRHPARCSYKPHYSKTYMDAMRADRELRTKGKWYWD